MTVRRRTAFVLLLLPFAAGMGECAEIEVEQPPNEEIADPLTEDPGHEYRENVTVHDGQPIRQDALDLVGDEVSPPPVPPDGEPEPAVP